MAKIDSGLGWKVDEEYYIYDARTHTYDSYYKENDGAAIIAVVFNGSSSTGYPVMISTVSEYADDNNYTPSSVVVDDITWYGVRENEHVRRDEITRGGAVNVPSEIDPYFWKDSADIRKAIVEAIIEQAGVELKPKLVTTNWVKDYVEGLTKDNNAQIMSVVSTNYATKSSVYTKTESDDTYIKDLSIDDKTITYTKGDGDTGTITTQDYRVKTEAKASTDIVYLAGTTSSSAATGTLKIDTGVYIDTTAGKLHVTTIEATNVTGTVSGKASTAGTADKLGTNAGSATQPVYFANGIPVATTYTLGKSVPSDAKFTDTTYSIMTGATTSVAGNAGLVPAPNAGDQDKFLRGDGTWAIVINSDTNVKSTESTTTKGYLLATSTSGTTTGEAIKDPGVYLDTTAGSLTATQFNGELNGKASTAGKLHSAVNITVGNKTNSFDGSSNISFNLTDIGAQAAGSYAAASHTHNYAGSSSSGGAATSADKLNTNAGSATQPVYFANGVPVACSYSLNKSVPSDAKFTDTTYNEFTAASSNAAGSSGLVPAPSAGDQTKFLRADKTWTTITPTLIGAQVAGSYAASDHTHNYAGSSSAGGAANSLAGFQATSTANLGINRTDVKQAIGYVSGLTKAAWNYQQTDGALYSQVYSASWQHQIYGDYRTGQMSLRGRNNGTWQNWRNVLDSSNYASYVTPDGIGAVAESSVVNTPSASEISTTISEIWD